MPLNPIKERIAAGLITERKHATADLYIYNYTPQCQFGRNWDEYTLMCRGLILDSEGNIVARPFSKFFNVSEFKGQIPHERFVLQEKMDGSLGVLYKVDGQYFIATRGSFESDQAIKGTAMLQAYIAEHGTDWLEAFDKYGYSYLFEIIYPENRIVVDYKGAERLVLLAMIRNEDGAEGDIAVTGYKDPVLTHGGPTANSVISPEDIRGILGDIITSNREGFVLKYASGFRLKFKFDEYVRLHRILTETSSTVVWEVLAVEDVHIRCPGLDAKQVGDAVRHIDRAKIEPILLQDGKALGSLLENVPDEFYDWLKDTMRTLTAGKDTAIAKGHAMVRDHGHNRLELIKACGQDGVTRAIALSMLDGKTSMAYGLAWRSVKPEWTKPFLNDEG